MSTLLIVDPTLKSFEGHSYNYDHAVYRAAQEVFGSVAVYADCRFDPAQADIPIVPTFNRIDFDSAKALANKFFTRLGRPTTPRNSVVEEAHATVAPGTWPWLLNFAKWLRARDFEHHMYRLLQRDYRNTPVDLFVQHAFISELFVVRRWLRRRLFPNSRFHVVMRYAPELVNAGYMSDSAFAAMLREIADPRRGNCRLYSDSERLSVMFSSLVGTEVITLPIPIPPELGGEEFPPAPPVFTLGFLGSPRIDKGFAELPSLLGQLPAKVGDDPLHVLIQATLTSADPRVIRTIEALRHLQRHDGTDPPRVELLASPAPSDVYYGWFRRASVIVLPYVARKYQASTSGILVEAILSGVPVLVPTDSWMADQVEVARQRYRYRIGEVFDGTDELRAAISKLHRELPSYRADTGRYRSTFQSFHNPRYCVELLYAQRAT